MSRLNELPKPGLATTNNHPQYETADSQMPTGDTRLEGQWAPASESQDRKLIAELLHEQQELTAIQEFSQHVDQGVPEQSRYYSKLLPTESPAKDQQYAFEVDLDRCSGCKACVAACHSLNGLEDNETWREVGLLLGGTKTLPVIQHVTTSCHHCIEPGCLNACPVNAYEKDPDTGIVKHLDDQCFGCQYCTLACPYDVPQFLPSKGIVRKCDMCSDRLSVGEAPACVQSCPHEAISITLVDVQQVVEDAEAAPFLPAAPDPQITLPTTHFKTSRVFPRNTLPADYYQVRQHAPHWPLIVMLVLTQLSVGALLVNQIVLHQFSIDGQLDHFGRFHAMTSISLGLLALAASVLHLGRPHLAFRAVLGLKHSWLSREILAFGLFALTAIAYASVEWMQLSASLAKVLGIATVTAGVVGVLCSVMIYAVTQRDSWSFSITAMKFALTSVLLGIATTWLTILAFSLFNGSPNKQKLALELGSLLLPLLVVSSSLKVAYECAIFRHLLGRQQTSQKRTALLLAGPLSSSTLARFAAGVLGGIVMPLFLYFDLQSKSAPDVALMVTVGMLFVACLAGELIERYQFFAACSAPQMPGRLRT